MRRAWLVTLLVPMVTAACAAEPSPTAVTRSMTVTVPIPAAADKAESDAAGDILSARLRTVGISNFTMSAGDVLTFTMQVPLAIDDDVVDAVLQRRGLLYFVRWPFGSQPAAPGDLVPPEAAPLFNNPREFTAGAVATDPSGLATLDISLGTVAREAVASYTTQHIGGVLPLALDGIVLTAPTIQSPITDGAIRLTAPDQQPVPLAALAAMIASGPLPVGWGEEP